MLVNRGPVCSCCSCTGKKCLTWHPGHDCLMTNVDKFIMGRDEYGHEDDKVVDYLAEPTNKRYDTAISEHTCTRTPGPHFDSCEACIVEARILEDRRVMKAKEAVSSSPKVDELEKVGLLLQEDETRVTDLITGAEKGSKLARFSLIPPEFLWALAEHYGRGAKKYADRNWEAGYKWSLSLDALERHLNQFKMGEWLDQETGTPHLIAVAWHACALFIYKIRGKGTNDITTKPLE